MGWRPFEPDFAYGACEPDQLKPSAWFYGFHDFWPRSSSPRYPSAMPRRLQLPVCAPRNPTVFSHAFPGFPRRPRRACRGGAGSLQGPPEPPCAAKREAGKQMPLLARLVFPSISYAFPLFPAVLARPRGLPLGMRFPSFPLMVARGAAPAIHVRHHLRAGGWRIPA